MRLAALLALLLAACAAPSQHDPSLRPVTVALQGSPDGVLDWRADQRAEIVRELDALGALGPSFVLVADALAADLVVREFDSGPGCAGGVEQHTLGSRIVLVDPVCAHGFDELRTAVGHGIGHGMGMGHVCLVAGDAADCHGAYGPALMNPSVSYGDVLEPGRFTGVGTSVPTELDLAEWRRVHP
jgi:hypothetical protein